MRWWHTRSLKGSLEESELQPFTIIKQSNVQFLEEKVWRRDKRASIQSFEAKYKLSYTEYFRYSCILPWRQSFSQDASFVKEAPFISSLIQNPNHIGCHTLGHSEPFFQGTQEIEKELIEICAVDILKGKVGEQDGYVASGGTEANIQAIWIYRNLFMKDYSAEIFDLYCL